MLSAQRASRDIYRSNLILYISINEILHWTMDTLTFSSRIQFGFLRKANGSVFPIDNVLLPEEAEDNPSSVNVKSIFFEGSFIYGSRSMSNIIIKINR